MCYQQLGLTIGKTDFRHDNQQQLTDIFDRCYNERLRLNWSNWTKMKIMQINLFSFE